MARDKCGLDERIKQLELELFELEEQYKTQLYFETMPEYDPVYKYCYATSNMKIPHMHQHVDYWIRAVIKHMATRREGHGGAGTSAVLVSVPIGLSDKGIEQWMNYTTSQLKTNVLQYKKRNTKND